MTPESVPSAALSAVSVFDSHCAPIYLRDKTDVAFRPFSLDIFDKLSAVCTEVRRRLEAESVALGAEPSGLPNLTEGTQAQTLIKNLTSLTSIDEVRSLATLSKEEDSRLKELRDQQRDLQAANPKQRAQDLKLKADRLQNLVNHLQGVSDGLSESQVSQKRHAEKRQMRFRPDCRQPFHKRFMEGCTVIQAQCERASVRRTATGYV